MADDVALRVTAASDVEPVRKPYRTQTPQRDQNLYERYDASRADAFCR